MFSYDSVLGNYHYREESDYRILQWLRRRECKAYIFDILKFFETLKDNRKSIDDNEHRLTTSERQVQWLNTTYITFIIANLFYDIRSMVKWFDFARPEGFDIIHLLMTKLQTGRNYLLINKIRSNKTKANQDKSKRFSFISAHYLSNTQLHIPISKRKYSSVCHFCFFPQKIYNKGFNLIESWNI